MKNVFQIIEENENDTVAGRSLIDRKISPEVKQRWNAYFEKEDPKTKISPIYAVCAGLLLLLTILAVALIVQDSAVLRGIGFAIALLSLIGALVTNRKMRQASEAARAELKKAEFRERQALWQATLDDFHGPADAPRIDVLDYEPGEKKQFCVLSEVVVFMDGGRLCFADEECRLSLDPAGIRRFYRVSERMEVLLWNKEIPAGTGIYANVKVKRGMTTIPGYAVLEFTEGGEDFGIWLPDYDVPALERVLGMTADPAKEKAS